MSGKRKKWLARMLPNLSKSERKAAWRAMNGPERREVAGLPRLADLIERSRAEKISA